MLITLFIAAFTSATLLPGSSELVLLGVLAAGEISLPLVIGVATLGNTLGSCVNWGIGRFFATIISHSQMVSRRQSKI